MHDEYVDEVLAWRRLLDERLRRRDGWLALAGLIWLDDGSFRAGSDPAADIRLPESAPRRLGTFEVRQGRVSFRPEAPVDGAPPDGEPLRPDTHDDPHYLRAGDLTIVVIERGGRVGLRVWDNARPQRAGFAGRTWYDVDPAWRIEARFEPADGGTIEVPNILGGVERLPLVGLARFGRAGAVASLRAVPSDDGRPWFLFGDPTNGETTYPAGRFLVADPPRGTVIVLDFNRAYNPPCAFTPYATCPLPPEGNRLPFPVLAGERVTPVVNHE